MVLPLPEFYDPTAVERVYRVPYQERASQARAWADRWGIASAQGDSRRVCLVLIDVQNTFCLPEFELFVGGRSGRGAIADNQRLCEFIYRNLDQITTILPTLDTHNAAQIFHPLFWVNPQGQHPDPMANITHAEVVAGAWRINPAMAPYLPGVDLDRFAQHYTHSLESAGKFPLTIWPYHSMLGGIGHALVSAVEEACFFHSIARNSPTRYELKGSNPLTENYSVLSPEVLTDGQGGAIAQANTPLVSALLDYDAIVIAGQAKSHCVAWTVADLLAEIQKRDPALAQKVYLLEDGTSPVVVPGVVDFTDSAEATYQTFAAAGMHLTTTEVPLGEMVAV